MKAFCFKKAVVCVCLAASVLLGACTPAPQEAVKPDIQAYVPPQTVTAKVDLFYLNASNKLFEAETRELTIPEGSTIARVAIENLVHSPLTAANAVAPSGVEVEQVTVIDKIAFLDFTYTGTETVSFENLRKACTLTLYHLCGVEYAILMVNGMIPADFSRGVSAVTENNTASFVLYYPTVDETGAVPSVSNVEITEDLSDRLVTAILEELKKTPSSTLLTPAIQQDTSVRYTIEDDTMEINLRISRYSPNVQSEFGGYCLALSILSTVPGIETIYLTLNNEPIGEGVFTLETLKSLQRAFCPVYESSLDGKSLEAEQRLVTFAEKNDPFCAVRELLQGTQSSQVTTVLPDSVDSTAFLGGVIDDNVAIINFSQAFYDACAVLNERRERMAVYAIVNALTEINGIDQVLFLCEGENVESLAGRISLLKPLLRNPGILG